jgi:hypothetical protein
MTGLILYYRVSTEQRSLVWGGKKGQSNVSYVGGEQKEIGRNQERKQEAEIFMPTGRSSCGTCKRPVRHT